MWRRASLVLLGLSLMACASAASPGASRARLGGRDVLTAAEIVAARATDVYQAVARLRPDFLRRRITHPASRQQSVAVYLDDLPYGTAESLSQIPLERVRMIRYISSINANLRFGGSHQSGAILVTTMPPR